MDDDFEKKIDIIFKRIEDMQSSNRERRVDIKLKRIESIVSSLTALIALIISFVTFGLTREQSLLDTTEDLALSVGSSNVNIIDLKPEETKPELYYRVDLSVCIINKSNLPIYINKKGVYRSDYGNDIHLSPTIHELDLPILMQPQETKFLDCYMQIKIPDFVNELIAEKFPDLSNTNFDPIEKYLFFEKRTNLIGDEVIVKEKDGRTHFKQYLTLPFSLYLSTSKGNSFSTQFYEGGPSFFLDNEYMDKLTEQYGSWEIEFDTKPIVDYSRKTFLQLIISDPSILLVPLILCVIMGFVVVGVLFIIVSKQNKADNTNNTNQQNHLQTEQNGLSTEDKADENM